MRSFLFLKHSFAANFMIIFFLPLLFRSMLLLLDFSGSSAYSANEGASIVFLAFGPFQTKKGRNITIAECRFIELPEGPSDIGIGVLGVSRGRLRLCKHYECLPESHEDGQDAFRVWDLKQVVKDNQGKFKWLVDRVSITWTDIGEFHPHHILVLSFHPSNEDMVYFRKWDEYLTCNFRGGMLEKVSHICSLELKEDYRYQFMLPWWPTPVPNL